MREAAEVTPRMRAFETADSSRAITDLCERVVRDVRVACQVGCADSCRGGKRCEGRRRRAVKRGSTARSAHRSRGGATSGFCRLLHRRRGRQVRQRADIGGMFCVMRLARVRNVPARESPRAAAARNLNSRQTGAPATASSPAEESTSVTERGGMSGYFACAGYTMRMATMSIQHAMAPRHQPSGVVNHPWPATVPTMPTAMARHPSANKT